MQTWVDALAFPEAPRWHDGALWCSDIADGTLLRIGPDGAVATVLDGLQRPSGLGWLPDGSLLIVEGLRRRLLRLAARGPVVHADLSALAPSACNDMVVDGLGRAWVGNWGFDYESGARPVATVLLRVDPDGSAHVVADGLRFPNGSVVTPDGRRLIVAEIYGARLSAFAIDDAGRLGPVRLWAGCGAARPDGICLDSEGAVWLASPPTREVLRVREGGAVTDRLVLDDDPVASMLGGPDRRTLFVLSTRLFLDGGDHRAFTPQARLRVERPGRIRCRRVDVPGAGCP